jgi:hypothetical protein
MAEGFSDKDSDWNFALAYLKRIDQLLQQCNYYKTKRDYDNWLLTIDALHTELYPRLEKTTKDGVVIVDEDKESNILRNIAMTQVKMMTKGNYDKWIIHGSLSTYERYLRNILRLRGMDLPKKSDPGHSMLSQSN